MAVVRQSGHLRHLLGQRGRTGRCQRILHRMPHRLMHLASVPKAHFDFGRVHVDVHPRRFDFHVQHIHRLAVAVQHVFIGGSRRVGDDFVADIPLVDVGKLLVSAAPGVVGQTGAAGEKRLVLFDIHALFGRTG